MKFPVLSPYLAIFGQRSLVLSIIFCFSLLISIVLAVEPPQLYEFSFWTKPNVESDPRIIRISTHPCGTVAIAKVTIMPSILDDPALEPERVVEFSPEGKVLRRWSIPVDSTPIGIRDNRLLIEVYQSEPVRFWIGLDGNIANEKKLISTSIPDRGKCETIATEFGNSDYADCWNYRDLESGKSRILAFEGICA